MRIIAGEHRGRPIQAPPGRDTRPTTDRVRESLFSSIISARGCMDGACVFDAFAGSGALSFEALSRGAAFAQLCECDAAALKTIRQNAQTLKYDGSRARISKMDVKRAVLPVPPAQFGPYDLLFFDPPYAYAPDDTVSILKRLQAEGALSAEAIVVYERLAKADAGEGLFEAAGFEHVRRKNTGETCVDIYKRA